MGLTKNTTNILTEAALAYAEENQYSVIPINQNKKPYFKWFKFQRVKATAGEIKAWWDKWPNAMIGIVTGQISNLFVVDCDTEDGYKAVQDLLPDSLTLPTARTPRGGWHIYFQYPAGSKLTCKAGIMPGVDMRGNGGYIIAAPSMNGNGKKYEWLDGLSLSEIAPPPMPHALLGACNNIINNSLYRVCGQDKLQMTTKTTMTTSDHGYFNQGRRDEDIFHAANCLIKGGCEIPFAEHTLEILAKNALPPFPKEEIKTKIDSVLKRAECRERNITAEIRDWVLTTNGNFMTTDCHKELQLTTRDNMKIANMALSRLCAGDHPLLERYGNRRGCYRRVENDLEPMDFLNAPTEEFPLALPLGIDGYSILYPGNIIVIAGSKSAGKTAFLLNIVKDNMKRYDVVYLNSEMGETEFRKRLELFDLPLEDWQFKAYYRAANFADLITPEKKVFIIDFLEVTDEFWKVSKYIQDIHSKLKEGVCIIALQKSEGKASGRGGDFSKEKARLYIALDYLPDSKTNQLKIVEAKAWRTETNPRGMYRNYKLAKGANFFPVSNWEG